jgi:hypothetical protein
LSKWGGKSIARHKIKVMLDWEEFLSTNCPVVRENLVSTDFIGFLRF